jgi:hypothetical protein
MSLRVSPLDAAQRAIDHTRRCLFPFRFQRWLLLGFIAFLDQCGRGGTGIPGGNFPGGGNTGGAGPELSRALQWMGGHAALLAGIAAGVLLLVVLVSALVLWLNSRGIFMYLEAVASAPAELGVRFRAHAEPAQSLFAWRFGIAMAMLIVVLLLVGAGAGALFLYARQRLPGVVAALFVVALVLVLLVAVLGASLISIFLRDFVAPVQWRNGLGCKEAARRVLSLMAPHAGSIAVYVMLKIVFAVVLGIAALLAGCLTCCCAFLPVVAQVVLQPLFFFERAWSLFLLEQLGVAVFEPPLGGLDVPVGS